MENNYQLYNNSQHPCVFFKQSLWTTCSIQLMNTSSPTDLMPMLQQQQQPWKPRTRDMEVQEILRERREVIETGKLKGRRLFEPIQRGTTTILNDVLGGDDMGQESEVRSLSFDYSEDETNYSPPSSSSLVCLSCDSLDKDQEGKEEEEEEVRDVCNVAEARVSGNEGRCIILLGVISIALLIFAICKSWVRRFEEHAVILVPT